MEGMAHGRQRLSEALLDLHDDAMMLEELDGFIAGVLVCPEMIPPSVWLPCVWDREGDPAFEDLAHANEVLGLIMEHYNDVALTLFERPQGYAPLFAIDERNGDILWELWIAGFDRAAKLRPDAWLPLMADRRAAEAWRGLMTLVAIDRHESRLPAAQIEALRNIAPEKIAAWVLDLNDWRLAQLGRSPRPRVEDRPLSPFPGKVGRNDRCPCGSGRKYKKCCGMN